MNKKDGDIEKITSTGGAKGEGDDNTSLQELKKKTKKRKKKQTGRRREGCKIKDTKNNARSKI